MGGWERDKSKGCSNLHVVMRVLVLTSIGYDL